ncbi:MAG: Holliday junction branch migration protein RuvA [Cyclobacteriaceae bacterium]|nr:Holliday junction branch migration protein RuvA [Cyclobacteriaceae bacterium]MCH8515034.1 Holliday junction branch migration protein RuvA [Cyclobacteriaceae bacterium]
MISFLEGDIAEVEPTHIILQVGGIGYQVSISLSTYSKLKGEKRTKLYTHFHVKEDGQSLYGFLHPADRKLFQALISISGVGPTTAMTFFSSLDADIIKRAIVEEDVNTIKSVKGIGAKTAQRIILELKDKLGTVDLSGSNDTQAGVRYNTNKEEALNALITLGYPKNVAEKNLNAAMKKLGNEASIEELIKAVLKSS